MNEEITWKFVAARRLVLFSAISVATALSSASVIFTRPVLAQVVTTSAVVERVRGDIAGNWQGTLEMEVPRRMVLSIAKSDKGWNAKMFLFVEQGAIPLVVNSITLDGSNFKYSVNVIGASYVGTLSADGDSIVGTMTGGPKPQLLTLVRATTETTWEIPAPPPPPKMMASDADPSFDVATIKPNDSGTVGMQQLTIIGRNFTVRNGSLVDLISFAYEVQAKQIIGNVDRMDSGRYDIVAVPDKDGTPNPEQLRMMIRKLLKERFKLAFHHDKRELSAFVLTVGKGGHKLAPTQMSGPLPGIGMRAGATGLTLNLHNVTLRDFTSFLQTNALDRPVIDKTEVKGRFDFLVTFTPDDSQFHGHPPSVPQKADNVEAAPGLAEALQQQAGLKVDTQKTSVDVLVIDHVEKPSAN